MFKQKKFRNMFIRKYHESDGIKVYTPVSGYQRIRKKEFNQRKWYDVLNKDGIM